MSTVDPVAIGSNLRWTDDAPVMPERPAWQAEGACIGSDPDVFFPTRGEDQTTARAICRRCPVRVECLEYALEWRDDGIWGGTSARERKKIRLARGIPPGPGGRPRSPDTDRRAALALTLRQAGMTATEIAAELGIDRRTVHRYFEAAS